LNFGLNPFFGQSPFADPNYLNHLIEHIKQHMTLWYLNRSNSYVAQSRNGKPVDNYDDPQLTAAIDQVYAVVGAHVSMDTQEVFEQFVPAFQQLIQQAQQRQQQAQQKLPPDAQVVKDTSMAETQRKAQADAQRTQEAQARIAADAQKNAENNHTKIAIENAKLTGQVIQEQNAQQNAMQMHGIEQANDMQKHAMTAAMQQPSVEPSPMAQQPQQPQLGAQNGNI
jgi:hypothetical protein